MLRPQKAKRKMEIIQSTAPQGKLLDEQAIVEALKEGLEGRFVRQKVLVLIPDATRSLPLPLLFSNLVEILGDAAQLDFMVALGTHPALSDAALDKLLGITAQERSSTYGRIKIMNHAWDQASALTTLGVMELAEMQTIAGACWHPTLPERVEIRINTAALDHDQILIVGPTFPHEVAGFSGGAKYLFPGISGPEMIHAMHWLGALQSVVGTIGIQDTPVRRMIHAAAERLQTPVTLLALSVEEDEIGGIFIGDLVDAWQHAVRRSRERHIRWCDKPFQRVLSCAPAMYDELWTAAKAMYKLEPAIAHGGEVIIHAPHLDTVSHVHGKYIYDIGYHILPYFLNEWERFKHIPLGVLAHSTHLRGAGVMEKGIEKANLCVTLASRISQEDCIRLNLGYLDPAEVNVDEWKNREEEGVLYVPRAGEILYRVKDIHLNKGNPMR